MHFDEPGLFDLFSVAVSVDHRDREISANCFAIYFCSMESNCVC